MAKKRIAVTGGAGFLGSHLCERLLAGEHDVVCLDNFFTGTRKNVEHLLWHPRFEVVRHDVVQPIVIEVDQIFIVQALRGDPITIYGDGRQTRSFCFVDDMVDALVRLMNTPEDPGPINFGNPREIMVLELAKMTIELVGSPSRLRQEPLPADDPVRRKPDILKAEELLAWRPSVSIKEGLTRTIGYFKSIEI